MSISYKKYARQIPDWKKYRKQALFEGTGLQCQITIFYLKCHKYTHLLILENFSQLQIFVKYLTQYYFSSRTFYFKYFC